MRDPEIGVEDPIERADQALLLAKAAGRSRAINWDASVTTGTRLPRLRLEDFKAWRCRWQARHSLWIGLGCKLACMEQQTSADASVSRLVSYLLETGIAGLGPLSSAESLAAGYLNDQRYRDDDERVAALINWETAKNFTTGFATGLGGFITLPVAIPAALAASWVVQARMAGAIARIYGHDVGEERVRTKILLALAGDVARDAMKDLGLKFGDQLTQRAVDQIPGRALVEVNKRLGAQLLAKVGQRVALRFPRAVPVFGGVLGGSLDAVVCRKVGATAKSLFRPPAGAVMTGEVVRRGLRSFPEATGKK